MKKEHTKSLDEQIIHKNDYFVEAGIGGDVCPLNWLAEFYASFEGKLVVLDDATFDYLVNRSKRASVECVKEDEETSRYTLIWNASQDYDREKGIGFPETRIVILSYGPATEPKGKDQKYQIMNGEQNWHVIEQLVAEDIMKGGAVIYAKDKEGNYADSQILYMTAKGNQLKVEETDQL